MTKWRIMIGDIYNKITHFNIWFKFNSCIGYRSNSLFHVEVHFFMCIYIFRVQSTAHKPKQVGTPVVRQWSILSVHYLLTIWVSPPVTFDLFLQISKLSFYVAQKNNYLQLCYRDALFFLICMGLTCFFKL